MVALRWGEEGQSGKLCGAEEEEELQEREFFLARCHEGLGFGKSIVLPTP